MTHDFSHLRQLEVRRERAFDYTIFQLEDEPVLECAPATEANSGYFNAVLRGSSKSMRRMRRGKIDAKTLRENRAQDRALFPKYVVKGWRNVNDASGQPVEFSEEACAAYLVALPNWVFDDFRTWAGDPENFIDDPEEAPPGAEEVEELGEG